MLLYAKLGGEDMLHHTLLVYNVGHPTREETEGPRHPVQRPHLSAFVAEQGEG